MLCCVSAILYFFLCVLIVLLNWKYHLCTMIWFRFTLYLCVSVYLCVCVCVHSVKIRRCARVFFIIIIYLSGHVVFFASSCSLYNIIPIENARKLTTTRSTQKSALQTWDFIQLALVLVSVCVCSLNANTYCMYTCMTSADKFCMYVCMCIHYLCTNLSKGTQCVCVDQAKQQQLQQEQGEKNKSSALS